MAAAKEFGVHRSSSEAEAVARAQWLAELDLAIDEAQELAWRLGRDNGEAMDLYGRLELARAEVESIRRSGWATKRQEFHPQWIELLSIPPIQAAPDHTG